MPKRKNSAARETTTRKRARNHSSRPGKYLTPALSDIYHFQSTRKNAHIDVAAPASSHPHGDFDAEKLYKLRAIIDEDKTKRRYLVDWEDDEETGEKYTPTWEPFANANKEAIEDWRRTKAARRKC